MPSAEPLTEKELDHKLRQALIEPQQTKPVGDNTIPPHYSREMSRYEPPIPVKEKEKEEALEKVREMTNGGSKRSKNEKQVEGVTDLSWDHEGLEPHLEPSKPKPPRSPIPSRVPRTRVEDKQSPVKTCPKCRENHDEKDCPKFLFKEKREKLMPPQSVKQNLQTDKSKAKVAEKWELVKKDSVIKKDTEKWVEEQNEYFKKEKEKQKEEVPVKFEPRGPVKILQRQKYASTTIPNQIPRRPRDGRYSQRPPNYWVTEYEGARYEKELGAGYNPKEKKWPQGNGYRKRYGTGEKKETGKSYKSNRAQSQTYYTTQGPRRNGRYLPAKGPGNGQNGNGEMRVGMIRRNLEILESLIQPKQKLKLSMNL